jgi:hypothetical protein
MVKNDPARPHSRHKKQHNLLIQPILTAFLKIGQWSWKSLTTMVAGHYNCTFVERPSGAM